MPPSSEINASRYFIGSSLLSSDADSPHSP